MKRFPEPSTAMRSAPNSPAAVARPPSPLNPPHPVPAMTLSTPEERGDVAAAGVRATVGTALAAADAAGFDVEPAEGDAAATPEEAVDTTEEDDVGAELEGAVL